MYFVRPTVIQADNPAHEVFTTEYFRPILGVFVYDDADYEQVIRQAADIAAYGLTGAVIAQDRAAIVEAMEVLRASPPATSISTTSPPVRWSDINRSAVPAQAVRTTKWGRFLTCWGGFHLAEAGVRDIVVVERDTLGSGSSAKPLGGVRATFSDPGNIQLGQCRRSSRPTPRRPHNWESLSASTLRSWTFKGLRLRPTRCTRVAE